MCSNQGLKKTVCNSWCGHNKTVLEENNTTTDCYNGGKSHVLNATEQCCGHKEPDITAFISQQVWLWHLLHRQLQLSAILDNIFPFPLYVLLVTCQSQVVVGLQCYCSSIITRSEREKDRLKRHGRDKAKSEKRLECVTGNIGSILSGKILVMCCR